MQKLQCFLFVLKQSYTCYYITCITVILMTFSSTNKTGTTATFWIINTAVSVPLQWLCGNADINVSNILGSFVDVTKCSTKLHQKIGLSTDSLVIKNVFGFNTKSIKMTILILKLVLLTVLKLTSETPINYSHERVDTTGSISLSHFFPKRLIIDLISQSHLTFEWII